MLIRLPSLLFVRLWAALMLATVGLQAGAPIPPLLETAHGSAFSATTEEVALTPARRTEAARPVVAPQPLAVVMPQIRLQALTPALALAQTPAVRPDSTGPPSPRVVALRPAPRAPPHT